MFLCKSCLPGESLKTLCANFLLSACAMMEAGSLGSVLIPALFVGRRGVPPGDFAIFTVRNFTLPISRRTSDIFEWPGVVKRSVDCTWEGPGIVVDDKMAPPECEGVDAIGSEPISICRKEYQPWFTTAFCRGM